MKFLNKIHINMIY